VAENEINNSKAELPKPDEETETRFKQDSNMSFMSHLSELRKRLMYSALGLVVGMAVAAFFVDYLVEMVLLHPAIEHSLKLQNLKPFGQPILYFKIIFIAGFVITLPYLIYQLWKFISPGLYINEKKWVVWITLSASFSFILGILFSYFVMLPSMVTFAASFGSKSIENVIDINEYMSFYITMMLASGLVFELPILSFILTNIGIINSKFLRKYWRHSMIAILIIAAIVTPTPDPVTQLVFAAPLVILYESSIWVAKLVEKRKAHKARAKEEEENKEK